MEKFICVYLGAEGIHVVGGKCDRRGWEVVRRVIGNGTRGERMRCAIESRDGRRRNVAIDMGVGLLLWVLMLLACA